MHQRTANRRRPIGVFDSGVGGLTVYRDLREVMPREDFIYLGDTARVPYGTKSQEKVTEYSLQIASRLIEENIKMLVVACNTATALALSKLREVLPDLPCFGVIDPGADAAVRTSSTGNIVVLATEATVRSGAYKDSILKRRSDARVESLACNLLVVMAEEGWCDGAEADAVVARYLRQLDAVSFDTLVLGCTHFPLLARVIRSQLHSRISIVDSAATTALAVHDFLLANELSTDSKTAGRDKFLVTDAPDRFRRLAARFLPDTDVSEVEVVELKNH